MVAAGFERQQHGLMPFSSLFVPRGWAVRLGYDLPVSVGLTHATVEGSPGCYGFP